MRQRPENFKTADGDPEATLVTPRFDDEEARRAHPVVPLAEARAPYAGAHARRGPRRSWPPALLAVALLAAVAVGAVASMVLRRTPSNPPAAVAPAQAADVPAQVEPPAVADAKPETRAPRDSQARRDEGAPVRARDEGGRDDRKGFEDEDRRDKEREKERERRRERREDKAEAEAEKEMRKALKRARDKAPRLVDVIVNPGN